MPFHPDDDADHIRSERRRAANRLIARARYKIGDDVEILAPKTLPGLALVEPKGIVVGIIPEGDEYHYRVLGSLTLGMEMPNQFAEAELAPVAG